MDSIQKKVFAAFQAEHTKHLAVIHGFLDSQRSGQSHTLKDMDDLKRCAHTLKGAARAAGLGIVQDLAFQLEKLFGQMKDGRIELDEPARQDIETVLDGIETHVIEYAQNEQAEPPQHLLGIMERYLKEDSVEPPPAQKALPPKTAPEVSSQESDLHHKVLAAFQSEHRIHMEAIRRVIIEITDQASPSDQAINTALRSAHTLKGAARAVGLTAVQRLAHDIESLFTGIRDGQEDAKPDMIRAINKALDDIEDHVATLFAAGGSTWPPSGTGRSEKAIDPPTGPSKSPDPPETTEKRQDLQAAPSAGDVKVIRVDVAHMDRLQKTAEQIVAGDLQQQLIAEEIKSVERTIFQMTKDMGACEAIVKKTFESMEHSPEMQKVLHYFADQKQRFPTLAGKVRAVGRLQAATSRLNTNLSRQIQTDVQKARMVAAEDVFHFFRKMMRDLAIDEGKQIEFKIKGLEVRADRLVLERLKDPLMHMLRNAVSHGIETPDERKAAGKDPTGTVHFIMEIENNRMRISIEDDGRGLDFSKISDLAVKKGYIPREQAEQAQHEELLRFIYQPGFTTVRMITDLHGRGLGMSVVRETVNRLRGEIEASSEANQGTRFVLQIPLTISTHQLLLVQVAQQTFGIPTENIERLLKINHSDIHTVEGSPVIDYLGQVVPFATLGSLLGINGTAAHRDNEQITVALLHSGQKLMGLAVDKVLSEQQTIIKDLPGPTTNVPYFVGGFVKADGSVSFILNPSEIMEVRSQAKGGDMTFGLESGHKVEERAKILIVDDSVTTRTLEKTILESQGYEVHLAVDGLEALNMLGTVKVDLVVTDIQMPQMDGFELIEAMKKTDKLKDLPVIVVTSMADQTDRERGLELGADAYIVKQKFDQKNLLETIEQIL